MVYTPRYRPRFRPRYRSRFRQLFRPRFRPRFRPLFRSRWDALMEKRRQQRGAYTPEELRKRLADIRKRRGKEEIVKKEEVKGEGL